jgi:Ca2+/H+ antiporter
MGLASREFNSTSANVYAGALQHATTEAMIVTFFTNKTRWAKRKKTNILF